MARERLSRRGFLKSAVAGTVAVSAVEAASATEVAPVPRAKDRPAPKYSDYVAHLDKGNEIEPATEDNIEGPFYRAGAPFRTKLYDDGEKGEVLVISGTVVARNGRPLAGALLEIWQASAEGRYDNDDPGHPPAKNEFRLRGRLKTNKEGRYEFETIRPAPYQIGPDRYRPAHIHVKVHQEGYKSLTTQFYFKGDKYNRTDPWYKPSLVLDLKPDGKRSRGTFKVVLARA
jgi:catechol 1,2-dioxygenase